MSNNLDNLFKKALQDKSCEPPPYIWRNIEQQLDTRKRAAGYWWLRGAAAAALVAALSGIWLLHGDKEIAEMVAVVREIPVVHADKDSVWTNNIPQADTLQPATVGRIEQIEIAATEIPQKIYVAPASVLTTHESGGLANTSPTPGLNTRGLRKNFIPLTSKEALQNNLIYAALLNEIPQQEKTEKDQVRLALSGHFVPAYASGNYSSSVKNPRGNSYSDSRMDGLFSAGGGLKLSVSAGKRFSLQTGLFYSRMGQKTTEDAGVRMAAYSLRNTNKSTTTPLGNIKSRTRSVAFRSPEAMVLNSIGNADQTLEQVFGTLEVPLYARYRLNNNKIRFSVIGGFSGNFIVDNKVYLKSGDNDKEWMGSTEGIRNFNMSTDWGLGVEYPVTRKIKVMIEPGFKYYLQSLSRNSDIDFKPYMFSLSTGIGIEF